MSAEPIDLNARRRQRPAPISFRHIKGMITDDRGRLVPNIANVLAILRNVTLVERCFAYDEMLCATMLASPLPIIDGEPGDFETDDVRPVRDDDATRLQEWLQHIGLPKI